ncbi:MAG: hypothetical protein AABO58_12475 [Acidobacteriota bacterium]
MRYAQPHELKGNVVPVLQLHLSEKQFERMFPVRTVGIDALAAAEPSKGALIRLESGSYVVVTYGEITHRVTVEVPQNADARTVVRELFEEVDIPGSAIEWIRENVKPRPRRRPKAVERSEKHPTKTAKRG